MHSRKVFLLGLMASLALAPSARAQVPPLPTAPAGLGAPAAAPAAPSSNLWSFLCPTADQKTAFKTCFCNSAIGQLTSSAAGPLSAMTGGLMSNCCLQNSIANDIANNPADSSQGAAARIKKDEEDAKARRAAVRYLGTVDCNYWPEAIDVLKKSLRKDPNECVRFEAALALGHGCCCNVQIVEALTICVMGTDQDKAPPERSDRVRAAAADALAHCVLPVPDVIEKEKEKAIQKTDRRNEPQDYYAYYKKIAETPREKVVENARAVLVSMQKTGNGQTASSPAVAAAPVPAIHARPTSLSGIVANAFSPETGVSGAPRPPFFSGLTKALTGKQESGVPVRVEPVAPPLPHTAPLPPSPPPALPANIRETNVAPPLPRETKVTPPLPRETKANPPAEIHAPMPIVAPPVERVPERKVVVPASIEKTQPAASGNWYRAPEVVPSVGQPQETKANVPAPIDLQPVQSTGNWYRAPEVVPSVGQPQETKANVPAPIDLQPVPSNKNGNRAPEVVPAAGQPRETKTNGPASFEIKTVMPIEIGLPDATNAPKAPEAKAVEPGLPEVNVVAPVDLRFPAPANNGTGGQTIEIRSIAPPGLSPPVSTEDSPRESVGAVTKEFKKPTVGDPLPSMPGRR